MPSAFVISVIYAILSVVVAGAWVAGYLDKYQKIAQNALLGAMGENRMSYGLKSKHPKRLTSPTARRQDAYAWQVRSRASKSTTRTSRTCKAAWRIRQEESSAREALGKASGRRSARACECDATNPASLGAGKVIYGNAQRRWHACGGRSCLVDRRM